MFLEGLSVEPFVGFHAGNNLFDLGYMSYSNSMLPVDIKIGRYCSIAWGVNFISYNHPWGCLSTSIFSHDQNTDLTIRALRTFLPAGEKFGFVGNPQKKQVTIENDVWVGQNVSLMAGINLGTGCIVAANSVVTKDVLPYSIVGGNPAKVIKFRFSEEIVNELLESCWWDYNFTDFSDLNIGNPRYFLEGFRRKKEVLEKFCPKRIYLKECPFD